MTQWALIRTHQSAKRLYHIREYKCVRSVWCTCAHVLGTHMPHATHSIHLPPSVKQGPSFLRVPGVFCCFLRDSGFCENLQHPKHLVFQRTDESQPNLWNSQLFPKNLLRLFLGHNLARQKITSKQKITSWGYCYASFKGYFRRVLKITLESKNTFFEAKNLKWFLGLCLQLERKCFRTGSSGQAPFTLAH